MKAMFNFSHATITMVDYYDNTLQFTDTREGGKLTLYQLPESIFNHFTTIIPKDPDRLILNPHLNKANPFYANEAT